MLVKKGDRFRDLEVDGLISRIEENADLSRVNRVEAKVVEVPEDRHDELNVVYQFQTQLFVGAGNNSGARRIAGEVFEKIDD